MLYFFSYFGCLVVLGLLGAHPDQTGGFGYILVLVIISITSYVIVFNPWNKDLFNPLKLASGLYGLSFGFIPLMIGIEGYSSQEAGVIRYSDERYLDGAALIALLGFLVMIAAYMLTPSRIWLHGGRSATISGKSNGRFLKTGLIVGAVGLVSYTILVIKSGGISHFLSYTGIRPDIFQGTYGGYFWGTFFIISGFSVYCISKMKHSVFRVVLLTTFVSILYMLFQGREQSLTPFLIFTIFFHYMHTRLTIKQALVGFAIMLMLIALLGLYRSTEKSEIHENKLDFLVEFVHDSKEIVMHALSRDIERLDVLAAIYTYIEDGGEPLYGKSLMLFLGPISRIFFSDLQSAGSFLFRTVYPNHMVEKAGIAPSMTGELYISFGTAGVVIGMAIYGMLLKLLGNVINRKSINPVLFAAYPYALIIMTLSVIAGSHLLFKILIVAGGVLFASLVSRTTGNKFYFSLERETDNTVTGEKDLPSPQRQSGVLRLKTAFKSNKLI